MTDFSEYVEAKLTPTWAKRENGARLLMCTMGAIADFAADQYARAICSGLIASPHSPDDALQFVGKERLLIRYPGETAESYRARLESAKDTWDDGGGDAAVEGQLACAGFTGADVVFYPDSIGPQGQAPPYRSQFWVRIPLEVLVARPGWTFTPRWGSIVWGCFWWGFGALSLNDAALFWGIVNTFKQANHVCRGIELAT